MWPSLETTPKTITVAGNFVFITLGTLNRPDFHFEGAGNGPVVITWIGREHELYSGASPISLVEHCVLFRHDRRLLSLLGFVHNWPTSRLNGNGIMSSFFLSFHPVLIGNSNKAIRLSISYLEHYIFQGQHPTLFGKTSSKIGCWVWY